MSTVLPPIPEPPHEPIPAPTPYPIPEPGPAARRPSVLHLVMGLVFLGFAGLWALAASGVVDSEDTWLVPGLLVVAGVAGLVTTVLAGRRHPDGDPDR